MWREWQMLISPCRHGPDWCIVAQGRGHSTAAPVPNKYAFQATDKQMDSATA